MLDPLDDGVQCLTRMGLTSCQAKVYLAFARLGASTVKTVSRESKVPREYIYRIMPSLKEYGLVEKVVTKPARFIAVPIKDAFSILFESRSSETLALHKKTKELAKNFRKHKKISEEKPEFVVIPSKEVLLKRKRSLIDTKRCVDVITSRRRFISALSSYGEEALKRLEKGVRFRVITEKPGDGEMLPKIWQDLRGHQLFGLRYVPATPRALVTVYDNKEALFCISAASAPEGTCLWSNNASLLAVFRDYFEILWVTAMETSHYSIDNGQT